MRDLYPVLVVVLVWLGSGLPGQAQMPSLQDYARNPLVKDIAISDNGARIAMLREDESGEYVLVRDLDSGESTGFRVENIKPLAVDFLGDGFVKLDASATENHFNIRGDFEYGFAYIFNVSTGETYQLLAKEDSIVPGSNATNVIGLLTESEEVLIGAYRYKNVNSAQNIVVAGAAGFSYDVYRVKLDTGRVRLFEGNRQSARLGSGSGGKYEYVVDWVVDGDGSILAREEYDGYRNAYRILTKSSGKWETVLESDPAASSFIGGRPYVVVGSTPERDALVALSVTDDKRTDALFRLDYEGERSEPLFSREGADIGRILTTDNRAVFGVQYTGLMPGYEFLDPVLQQAFDGLFGQMPDFSVTVIDWTADLSKFIVQVAGGAETGGFYLFDISTGRLSSLAASRDIPAEWVGQTQTIEYKSSDGWTIPSIVTWPAGEASENLPMIVLPHGGPASHDAIGFDWMAQYFASRGYLVFQPNFRGSDGFGQDFMQAGYGEWGGQMQSDITTGVKALASLGWVDPDRVCIVGASFGGYAALAGGAFTPELYKCVAAIAPVTDLPQLLEDTWVDRGLGKRSYAYEYWTALIGDPEKDGERMRSVSPARHAEKFSAPVLLVHGRDDTVVKVSQSRQMSTALKEAGKPVQLVEIDGADHWLTTSPARIAALSAVAKFIETNNPPD